MGPLHLHDPDCHLPQCEVKPLFNVVSEAAIISNLDGAVWASTPNFKLGTYVLTLDTQTDGEYREVIDETKVLLNVAWHSVPGTVTGIFLRKKKYVNVTPLELREEGVAYLVRKGGGACLVLCKTCVVVGFWDQDKLMSNGIA